MLNTLGETVPDKMRIMKSCNHFPNDPRSPASSASCHALLKLQSDLALSSTYEQKPNRAWERKQTPAISQMLAYIWLKHPWVPTAVDEGDKKKSIKFFNYHKQPLLRIQSSWLPDIFQYKCFSLWFLRAILADSGDQETEGKCMDMNSNHVSWNA